MNNSCKNDLRILCIGNSFAADTIRHIPDIARDLGIEKIHFGNLYIGGCSINRHYANFLNDAADYTYYSNNGSEWSSIPDYPISKALESQEWDWISIQHGTGDGSRYTLESSYENLPKLVQCVKEKVSADTRIAFNMAWVMEPYSKHPEIRSYMGDQKQMYKNLVKLTETVVLPTPGLDLVSPAGTAIQNARTTELDGKLSRDGFHLSYGLGRYIAGLTFLKALTGVELDTLRWMPDGTTEAQREIAIRCANNAIKTPFSVTPSF